MRDWTGDSVPFNVVPSGFVLVAALDDGELDRYLDGGRLARATARSLVDPADIRRRCKEVARTGFVWGYGEFDEGINSIAAPVRDRRGATVAALHIHGPAYRFPEPGTEHAVADQVCLAARRLSERL